MGPTRRQLRYIHLRHSVVSTIGLVMSWMVFVHSCFDRRQSHNRTTTKPQPNHDQTTPNPRAEPGDILAGHCCYGLCSLTAMPSRTRRISSDLRSSAAQGPVSTGVGDGLGIPLGCCQLFVNCESMRYVASRSPM